MSESRAGTFTVLVTDIVGSTELWEGRPMLMLSAVSRHDRILQDAIQNAGGRVFRKSGDGFFAAFPSAKEALAAALASQRALHDEDWGELEPLRVGMAVHSGVPRTRNGDYFGPTVVEAARLLRTAHGGQTLVSVATAELVRENLPPRTRLVGLDQPTVRDPALPEPIFQLQAPDLPSAFPPLTSLRPRRTAADLRRSPPLLERCLSRLRRSRDAAFAAVIVVIVNIAVAVGSDVALTQPVAADYVALFALSFGLLIVLATGFVLYRRQARRRQSLIGELREAEAVILHSIAADVSTLLGQEMQ